MIVLKIGKKIFLGCLPIFLPFILLIVILGGAPSSNSGGRSVGNVKSKKLSESVERYRPLVEKYASQYEVTEYVPYIMAIMQVESGGNLPDVMQSSESAGLPVNTLDTPEKSIEQGVKFFAQNVKTGKELNVDMQTIVASYNFGTAFMSYISKNGGKYSIKLAEKYSREVVAPSLGNLSGVTYEYVNSTSQKYNKTYLYLNGGNFFYMEKVMEYVETGSSSNVASSSSSGYSIPLNTDIMYMVTADFAEARSLILQDGSALNDSHEGIDLVYTNGDTDILASGDGEVVVAGWGTGYGNHVVIKHDDGLYTYYGHLLSLPLVSVGERVTKGQRIGVMGSTGWSTGTHLHLGFSTELYKNYINPRNYIQFKQVGQ